MRSPFYTVQSLSQGMVSPIVGESAHFSELNANHYPGPCPKANLA